MTWARARYDVGEFMARIFMEECPCCHGNCGYTGWYEPDEDCGYCDNKGRVNRYKAWEWLAFIERNLLPPSMVPGYLWNRLIYRDCPEHDWFAVGCERCGGRGYIRRFGFPL